MASIFSKIKTTFETIISPEVIKQNNEDFEKFSNLNNNEEVESIIDKALSPASNGADGATHKIAANYSNLVYSNISSDKVQRLKFYRDMVNYPYIYDALEEICDMCLTEDDNNKIMNLRINKEQNLNPEQETELRKEFNKFISLFDFDNKGFDYFWEMLRDGEIAFENIIDSKRPELGIIGVKQIVVDCYEYLIDMSYNIVGILLNAKILKEPDEKSGSIRNKLIEQNKKWSNLRNSYTARENNEIIPMPLNQITLINSGSFSPQRDFVYPILERTRRSYRQLTLLEDSSIIYRLVRTPERFLFNVDTGKLNPSKAEELVFKLSKKYKNKKGYDPQSGSVVNGYDPHQMRESWWFPKPEGSKGTEVTTLGGGASFGEMEDIQYFLRKLFSSLKIPMSRMSEEGSNTKESGESISYEEFRFAKFIIRLQNRFEKGLMESFKVHLKLIGLWDKFKLNKNLFKIKFVSPVSYDLYFKQQLLNLKMENFNTATGEEVFSKELAMKKYLGWTDEDIKQNNSLREKEILEMAHIERKADNISDHGTIEEPED